MSILDIVGPVIIGPSSSHTAGAARIGKFARQIYRHPFDRVEIDLYNSFAETGKGHGTDKAILGGILGLEIDDERLLKSYEIAKKSRIRFAFNWIEDDDEEPNTAKVTFYNKKKHFSVKGVSIGGGEVEIRDINGFKVCFNGKCPVIITTHEDKIGMAAFISKTIADLGINIASFHIDRDPETGYAMAVINLDDEFPTDKIALLKKDKRIKHVIRIEKLEE